MKSRKEIFNFVSSKKVLIWGARMTGIGALRQLKAKKVNILGKEKDVTSIKNQPTKEIIK